MGLTYFVLIVRNGRLEYVETDRKGYELYRSSQRKDRS